MSDDGAAHARRIASSRPLDFERSPAVVGPDAARRDRRHDVRDSDRDVLLLPPFAGRLAASPHGIAAGPPAHDRAGAAHRELPRLLPRQRGRQRRRPRRDVSMAALQSRIRPCGHARARLRMGRAAFYLGRRYPRLTGLDHPCPAHARCRGRSDLHGRSAGAVAARLSRTAAAAGGACRFGRLVLPRSDLDSAVCRHLLGSAPGAGAAMSRDTQLWIAVLAGPAAWFADLLASYALAPWACALGWKPALFAVTIAAIAATAASGLLAYRIWRQAGLEMPGETGGTAARARGLGLAGVLLSGLFFIVIAAQAVPNLMLRGCE